MTLGSVWVFFFFKTTIVRFLNLKRSLFLGGLQEEALPQVDVVIDTTHKVKDVYNIHEKLGV